MGFMKWIRRTLHPDNKRKRSNKEAGQQSGDINICQSDDTTRQHSCDRQSTAVRKSKLKRTHRSLSQENNNCTTRVLPRLPLQISTSLQWLDVDKAFDTSAVEHIYEEISDTRVYANMVCELKKKVMVKESRGVINERVEESCHKSNQRVSSKKRFSMKRSLMTSEITSSMTSSLTTRASQQPACVQEPSTNHSGATCVIPDVSDKLDNAAVPDVMTAIKVHRSETSLDSGYSHADSCTKKALTQRIYENVDSIDRRGMSETNTKCLSSEDEMQYHSDTYSGNFSLDTCRPDPVGGCDESVCDVVNHNDSLTTVSSLESDSSCLDFNTPAAPKMTVPLRTPGWRWYTDETTFAVLPAAEDDTASQSSSDSYDGMSMSMMAAELAALQQQLEMKKQKMNEKNRRRSCPTSQATSSKLL